ncbi:hypothetical protein AVEN_194625-1 [Araneus ventricosus]|uniref:Uncharacterized protein n=1 Tax=Araneus ventricosus TaxID=182803 RepID=A0A4Y2A6K9_ARAVE|nr:hypothetical protein AVEN_194625-1 [Araneus ventricosus]
MKFAKLLDKDSGLQKAAEVFKNHHAAAAREVVQNNLNLATLPPIEEASRLHLWRAFLQVNLWTGHVIDPIKWGWKCTNVPEDIKNRPKLDDDVIISDDEAVDELFDEGACYVMASKSSQ